MARFRLLARVSRLYSPSNMAQRTPDPQIRIQTLDENVLSILRCPVTGGKLRLDGSFLVSDIGPLKYPVRDGIPVLLPEEAQLPDGCENLDAFKSKFASQFLRKL